MQNRDSDLDVQPEDWERQSSEPADLEMEYRVDKVRVDERIKAIQIQLIRNGERMTRIEKGIENRHYNDLIERCLIRPRSEV